MDAVKFIKEKLRMCKSNEYCRSCELYDFKNNADMDCATYIDEYPEETVAIVEKWLHKHPYKTFLSDFFEKHPNAPKDYDDTPLNLCPKSLGYTEKRNCIFDCAKCWNRPLEE